MFFVVIGASAPAKTIVAEAVAASQITESEVVVDDLNEDPSAAAQAPPASVETPDPATPPDSKLQIEKDQLALANALAEEKAKLATVDIRVEAGRLKAETELILERLKNAEAKRQADDEVEAAKADIETKRLTRSAEIAKARAEELTNQLKAAQAEAALKLTTLQSEMQEFETAEQRKTYATAEPNYLQDPLRDDGTLIVSDRRIPLSGPITGETADFITNRIHYYNNQDRGLPIFLVIDESPGGSVMAGYRILKSMQASEAPVHVVVKSFAASMAAALTTLAEESYAYPNAIILHHQISAMVFGRLNLTQQAEFLKESERWWDRLAAPIADKMGISTDEFISQMYAASTSGDWSEFGEQAKELKWVNHIVSGIDETSLRRNPDTTEESPDGQQSRLETGLNDDGRPVAYLPRISPKDVYFLYNPDGYYQLR